MGVFRYAIVLLLALGAGRAAADEAINKVAFACAGDKTINAAFSPDKVDLTLSDGRTMSLPQAQSASGIRYTNPGESIVFWSKGNTAFITEGADKKETYAGCIVVAAAPGQNWATFASADEGFSLRFPRSYSVDTSYRYEALGPGKEIGGVSFTVPKKTITGTNLAADTRLSVEAIHDAPVCSAALFLPTVTGGVKSETQNGIEYSVGSLSDAAAGSLFDETVYALIGTSPCLAVRYFIHSANIGNFDPGSAKEFDRNALVKMFDRIRGTLVVGR